MMTESGSALEREGAFMSSFPIDDTFPTHLVLHHVEVQGLTIWSIFSVM